MTTKIEELRRERDAAQTRVERAAYSIAAWLATHEWECPEALREDIAFFATLQRAEMRADDALWDAIDAERRS